MQWQAIIEFLGGATVFAVVLGYLGQRAIDAYAAGRLEKYKGDLQRAATDHSIRYQRLHAERAEAIRDFYAYLSQLDEALQSTLARFQVSQDRPLREKIAELSLHFNSTRDYFVPRRIFFEESTCILVDGILDLAKGIFFDTTAYEPDPEHPQYKYDRKLLLERAEFWQKARAAHSAEFVQLKRALENAFRQLLGIGA